MKGCVAIKLWLGFSTLFSFSLKGSFCLFLKHSSGRCVSSATTPHLSKEWAKIWYLQLTNDCTAPEAQFRFIDQGVLHHVSSTGCVLPSNGKAIPAVGTKLVVFAAKDVCMNKSSQAYTQTDYGSLRHASGRCIQPHTSFVSVPPVGAQIEYTAVCNKTLQYFVLGSVTCEGNKTRDINCPASQVIKVTKANYGGYGSIKTCGYFRNYNCLLPSALCYVKRKCDGHQNCEMEVTTDEFKHDACPGMKKYLYVEYKCIDRNEFKKENMIIKKVRLASEGKPGQGYVELLEDSKPNIWRRLCMKDMKDTEKGVICRTLGYSGIQQEQSSVGSGQDSDGNVEMPVFHGNVYCNSNENNISACCLEKVNPDESACSTMAHVSCAICSEPVLSSKHHPAVIFSASSSISGYSADQAAMTSGSTWCARDTDESRDYLKIDLGEAYVIRQLAMLGNEHRGNWVTEYEVLYSKDENDWLPGIANGKNRLTGNSASDELSRVIFDAAIHARFIKVFPKSWQGLPCLKLEICGHKLLPDASTNITLSSLTAYTVDLTWIKPADTGDGPFTDYQISLIRDGKLDSNYSSKTGSWHFATLRPYTKYTVVVQAGNNHGYGRKTELAFRTISTAPTAPPLDIKLSPISSTSLSISWKAPPSFHSNGIITGYDVCFAWVESDENCDRILRTTANSISLGYLLPATEYKVKVLARNDAGSGSYSEEYFQITNAEAPVSNHSSVTSEMLAVELQKPREEVRFCQVIVTALPSDDSFPDQNLFSSNPVTYLDASGSPVPYIAAEFRASDFVKYQDFMVGDKAIFPALSMLNTNRSQAKKFFNGPLTPNTRYTLFQRFFSDKKLLYSSDFLAPVKTKVKTAETNYQVPPSYPPTDIQLTVESSTTLKISWKAPVLKNSLRITGYQVCIALVQSDEECDVILRTKAPTSVASGLATASKYKVKVSAKNIVGYGKYSKDYITITNAAPPVILPSTISQKSFGIKLEPPRKEIRFCQIILITLPTNGSLPISSQYRDNFDSYHDAKASTRRSSYVAAEFDVVDFEKHQEFTVGDGWVSLGVVGMTKYGTAVRKYFNGPLSPDTMYTVFQRFYNEQELVYISDFLPATKTKQKENFDTLSGSKVESTTSQEEFKLPFIIVIVLLLIVLLILGVVVIYRRRRMQQNNVELTANKSGSCTIDQTEHGQNEQRNRPVSV